MKKLATFIMSLSLFLPGCTSPAEPRRLSENGEPTAKKRRLAGFAAHFR